MSQMDDHRFPKWFYIGGDGQNHGPYSSEHMLQWWHGNYFNENLQLRTENDNRFYPLAEWIRACGNKIPFELSIKSMDWLQTENMNQLNTQMENMHNDSNGYSLSGTPASTPTPTLIRSMDVQQQQIPGSVPIQLLAASQQRQTPQRQLLLMSTAPPSLNGVNPTMIIPASTMPPFQFVQQRVQTAPPPSSVSHHQPFVPFRYPPPPFFAQRLNVNGPEQPDGANLISESPDSGHVVTPCSHPVPQLQNGFGVISNDQQAHLFQQLQHESKYVDTSDAPWKGGRGGSLKAAPETAEMGTNPDCSHFSHAKETQTEDINIKIAQSDAERLLSQWLGIRVRITLTSSD